MYELRLQLPRRARRVTLVALVDLVIILLIFFMLRTNFLDPRQVALHPAAPAASTQIPLAALTIELHANGSTWLEGAEVGPGGLAAALVGRRPGAGQQAVLLVDEGVVMQHAVDAIDALKGAGWDALALKRAQRFTAVEGPGQAVNGQP